MHSLFHWVYMKAYWSTRRFPFVSLVQKTVLHRCQEFLTFGFLVDSVPRVIFQSCDGHVFASWKVVFTWQIWNFDPVIYLIWWKKQSEPLPKSLSFQGQYSVIHPKIPTLHPRPRHECRAGQERRWKFYQKYENLEQIRSPKVYFLLLYCIC